MTKFRCLSELYFHSNISKIIFQFPTTMNINKHRSYQSDQLSCFLLSRIQFKSLVHLRRAASLRKSCALLVARHYSRITGRDVTGLPSFQSIELSQWGVVFGSLRSLSVNSALPACPLTLVSQLLTVNHKCQVILGRHQGGQGSAAAPTLDCAIGSEAQGSPQSPSRPSIPSPP